MDTCWCLVGQDDRNPKRNQQMVKNKNIMTSVSSYCCGEFMI